jgi:hypothetical protein
MQIPAGECVVQPGSMDSKALIIDNWAAKVGVFINPSLHDATKTSSANAMVFHKYEDR